MNPYDDLPPELASGPFRAETAARYGLTPDRLRSFDIVNHLRDVYVPRRLQHEPLVRLASALLLIPRGVLSHDSSLLVWQLPVVATPTGMPRRVHVTVPPGTTVPRIAGIMTHDAVLHGTDVHVCERPLAEGLPPTHLPVTVPARALLEVAGSWSVDDVVVAADAALRARRLDRAAIEDVIRRNRGRRGVTRLREALPLLDGRSGSAAVSRLRVLLVTSGVPVPRCGLDLYDSRGDWVATATLAWPQFRTLLMLDPVRPSPSQREEARRRTRLTSSGWAVLSCIDRDVTERPHEIVSTVWGTLIGRGWRPPTGAPPQGPGARRRGADPLRRAYGCSRDVA